MRKSASLREREERTRSLVAASARQRESIAGALVPLHARVQRVDGVVHWMRARACWVGLAAGLGFGLLPRSPQLVVGAMSVFARILPLWRALHRRRH